MVSQSKCSHLFLDGSCFLIWNKLVLHFCLRFLQRSILSSRFWPFLCGYFNSQLYKMTLKNTVILVDSDKKTTSFWREKWNFYFQIKRNGLISIKEKIVCRVLYPFEYKKKRTTYKLCENHAVVSGLCPCPRPHPCTHLPTHLWGGRLEASVVSLALLCMDE